MAQDDKIEGYENRTVNGQNFTLFSSHIEVEMPNGGTKAISLGDFTSILARTVNQERTLKTMLLPSNCYIFGQSLTEMKLASYYPGKVRTISHNIGKVTKYDIPFPNIVISHSLKRKNEYWEWAEGKYFATSKPLSQIAERFIWEPNQAEQIWSVPFTNMYGDGRMCYGGNSLTRQFKDNFRGLDWHFAILYTSPYNNDLGLRGLKTSKTPEAWYQFLHGKKVFPYEELVGGVAQAATTSMSQNMMAEDVEAT
jgi:hypothetical protein